MALRCLRGMPCCRVFNVIPISTGNKSPPASAFHRRFVRRADEIWDTINVALLIPLPPPQKSLLLGRAHSVTQPPSHPATTQPPTMAHPATVPHRLCSHLYNVSRAAIARTPLPYSIANLAITNILLRHGLISNITTGNPDAPNPAIFPTLQTVEKRLWVDMKYRNGLPVLRRIDLISKPSFRVSVSNQELGRILMGKRAQNIGGIGTGEIIVVKTPEDKKTGRVGPATYMEGWEAWRAGLGGELILRAA